MIGVLAPKGQQLGMNMDEVALVPVATAMSLLNRSSLFRILIEGAPGGDLRAAGAPGAGEVLTTRHGEEDVTL